jgi:anionic cell wall polymer biosynthesis LytR-Cps2A-Psr (LCP) family protein
MTTIRRQRQSAHRKWFFAVLAVVLLAVAAVLVFVKPLGDQVRKSPSKTDSDPQDESDTSSSSSSGRDITFEVTSLDGEEGSTDKFVVRTKPEWSPLGVQQFHVSQSRESL